MPVPNLPQRAAAALVLALLGCGEGPTDLPDASRDRIVFSSNASGNYDIYVMDQDGGNQAQLTALPFDEVQPAPSPDGTHIAFLVFSAPLGSNGIYVMNADGSGITQLTGLPGQFPGGEALWPSWSPDGLKILFTGYLDGDGDMFVMNADGTGWTNLTNDRGDRDEYGAWSPDGHRIAFSGWALQGQLYRPHIYVLDADGGGVRQVTSGDVYDFWPSWSPDSREIVFTRITQAGDTSRLSMVSSDGGAVRPLAYDTSLDGQASWSRDGKRLVFNSTTGPTDVDGDIWTSRSNGTRRVNLTETPTSDDSYPHWLPVP